MKNNRLKKLITIIFVLTVAITQINIINPFVSYAEENGNLEVRVQYMGDRTDKIRTKAVFSKEQMKSIGEQKNYYSNITSVGGVMRMVAKGPTVCNVIEAAGIDLSSVEGVAFVTANGKRYQNYIFDMDTYIAGTRWYYPNLHKYYDGDELSEGALDGAVAVESILAISETHTISKVIKLNENKMTEENIYRFCLGQSKLHYGRIITGKDVSSADSAYCIKAIDVILRGYPPVDGINLSVAKDGLTVGSSIQINAKISGGSGDVSDLTWASSNPDVATVSSSGMLTINGEGTTKITASADGVTASMTITVSSEEITKEIENPDFNPDEEEGEGNMRTITTTETVYNVDITYEDGVAPEEKVITKPLKTTKAKVMKPVETTEKKESKKTISAKQVQLNKIQQEPRDGTTAQNVQALEAAEQYGPGTKALAGGVGFGVFALGAAMRYRRYRIDR